MHLPMKSLEAQSKVVRYFQYKSMKIICKLSSSEVYCNFQTFSDSILMVPLVINKHYTCKILKGIGTVHIQFGMTLG